MFEQATLTAAPWSSRLWSTCAGITGQVLLVGCMLLAPLLWPAVLPQLQNYVMLTAPGPPPPPPPPVGELAVRPRAQRIPFQAANGLIVPVSVPQSIAIIDEPPEVGISGVSGGVTGGVAG